MQLKVLGSVSPYPHNGKNGVSNLIQENGYKVLLDIGPGSTSLLNMKEDLNNLIIIVSHLHKDHYADLLPLSYASYLYHKYGYLDKKIPIYIPSGDKRKNPKEYFYTNGWGDEQNIKLDKLEDYEYLKSFGEESYLEFFDYDHKTELKHGPFKITFNETIHPVKTYSAKVSNGKNSIVYSSDTGYKSTSLSSLNNDVSYNANNLSAFAKNTDLLICESTFLRGQLKEKDEHLYAFEAGLIARETKARELLLTHFFPEEDKKKYVDEAKEYFSNTSFAEENKVYKIGGK